jgi:hypothetical protein
MKKMLALSAVALAAIGLTYAQTQPEKQPSALSRYQLLPATATYEGKDGRQSNGPEVFLLDTETGRVWKYEFSRKLEVSHVSSPNYFEPVPVEGINGWHYMDFMSNLEKLVAPK